MVNICICSKILQEERGADILSLSRCDPRSEPWWRVSRPRRARTQWSARSKAGQETTEAELARSPCLVVYTKLPGNLLPTR